MEQTEKRPFHSMLEGLFSVAFKVIMLIEKKFTKHVDKISGRE
ncbi:hypothetical protein EAL2_808p07610 (plasmid) [Peptoclostridium acidaminophilum DSM 3953]|uniref:Uncharacterized protein n=1 Tax=Peptoclostridium acidaminophilum DSM 3953 TaxID=1286171 RepID=W8T9C5_PEPAC|nr:hypothetical protein EAL2_808p07610 [Peptoclostridium acidaminophilum DSM 3953]